MIVNVITFVVCISLLVFVILYLFSPKYPPHPAIDEIKRRLSVLNPKYGLIPIRQASSSYTDNKSIIYICLSHKNNLNKVYDINILMNVALHELAHVISIKYGHGQEWKDNFDKLLDQATDAGIYDPTVKVPDNYCGM